MRPLRIRAEGFSAYRSPVNVDLGGVEFFSLSGATGAGKSSLIDAMVFALYGRVPRLGGNTVAPAISAGADRARVALDFEVDGDSYTAVRLIQRSSRGGASVKEARLQKGDEVLADGADDVTRAVEDLLHLRFEDFVRTVVLPQGEFARFLTAPKAERQSLLRKLLGLDIYSQVRSLARTRESVAIDRAEVARARLGGIEAPDVAEVKSAKSRLSTLESLSKSIVEAEANLGQLEADRKTAEAVESASTQDLAKLEALRAPDRLEELDHLASDARERLEGFAAELFDAERVVVASEVALSEFPAEEVLLGQLEERRRLAELETRAVDLDLSSAAKSLESAEADLVKGRRVAGGLQEELSSARISHAAHALTANLVVGEPCPVCEHQVDRIPEGEVPAELAGLEAAYSEAVAAVDRLSNEAGAARSALAKVEATRSELDVQIDALSRSLGDAPSADKIDEALTRRRELSDQLAKAGEARTTLETKTRKVQGGLEELSESIRTIGRDLMAARQTVAALDPPLPESEDAIVQWKELMSWRDGALVLAGEKQSEARVQATQAGTAVDVFSEEIEAGLREAGIEPVKPYAVGVTRQLEITRNLVEEHCKAAAEAKQLETTIAASMSESKVAGALSNHLKANGFERWLMAGAMSDLVAGANGLLAQLSDGGHSLRSDEGGSFTIVDHRNANEERSVSTLSGGETFLVSLALALSLAETLAAAGGADLDAIILDEGFGTLDDESLEIVAMVLEELSGDGFVVGVITHVKELASRAPVRFEVSRGPGGATVTVAS
ncbi:MAG: SMC family ATPase [Actinomycetota bacterium]|nr:SMC family ATPase [Actinomycetota bacterium]